MNWHVVFAECSGQMLLQCLTRDFAFAAEYPDDHVPGVCVPDTRSLHFLPVHPIGVAGLASWLDIGTHLSQVSELSDKNGGGHLITTYGDSA